MLSKEQIQTKPYDGDPSRIMVNIGTGWFWMPKELCNLALRSLSEPAEQGETPRTSTCNLDVGCKETGKCFAKEKGFDNLTCGAFGPIDGNWANTSIENWFPYSAQELESVKHELVQMAEQRDLYKDDYFRRHKEAGDNFEKFVAERLRAESAERRVSELEAKLAEKSRGAERANEVTPQELGALVDRLDGVGVAWCTEADFATLLSAAKRDAERQDQAARYGFEPAETVLKTVQRVLDENSAWIAMPNREVEQRLALAVGFAASVAQEQLRHELMDRAESAERRVSELEAALAEKSRDAERLAYLTADHNNAEVRKWRNHLLCRMPVMSHSAACADIDIQLAFLAAERKEGKQHG